MKNKQKCCHCNTEFEYKKKDIHSKYIEEGITYVTGRYAVCPNKECKAMVFIDKSSK